MEIITERLCLRPWRDADAKSLYFYAKDPEVGPAAGWPPHDSEQTSLATIRSVLNGPECYAITEKENGTAIGAVELIMYPHSHLAENGRECELGYWLGKPFWGRGYIPEATECLLDFLFMQTDCPRVWCSHFLGNEKSKRVIEKCGFRPEFLQEREWPAIGKKLTEQFYSIRKVEYLAKHSAEKERFH